MISYVSRAERSRVFPRTSHRAGEIFLSDQGEPYPVAVNRQYFLACGAGRKSRILCGQLANFRGA